MAYIIGVGISHANAFQSRIQLLRFKAGFAKGWHAMRPTHTFQRKQRLNIPLIKKKLSDGLVEPFLFVPVNLAPLSLGTPTSHASSGSSHLAPAQDAHAEGHGLG